MPALASSNPDLALWIAGLGFLSSLTVVVINSYVTLKSKNKDVQLKKDEQEYGYKMEYLKRKLSAGEKAIGQMTLTLKTLSWLRQYYASVLSTNLHDEEIFENKKNNFIAISEKLTDAVFDKDNSYLAYYATESNYLDANHIILRSDNLHGKIQLIDKELVKKVKAFQDEKGEINSFNLPKDIIEMYDTNIEMITNYIALNDEARSEIVKMCERIRKQMQEAATGI